MTVDELRAKFEELGLPSPTIQTTDQDIECAIFNVAPKRKRGISVFRFSDAPDFYKALSPHGGDEDWMAVVPPELTDIYIPWLESGGPFGCCDVSVHDHPLLPGWKVHIGAHA